MTPSPSETWVQRVFSAEQLKVASISIPGGCFGLVVDLYLFVLPFLAICHREMQTKQKLKVLLMFSLGLL